MNRAAVGWLKCPSQGNEEKAGIEIDFKKPVFCKLPGLTSTLPLTMRKPKLINQGSEAWRVGEGGWVQSGVARMTLKCPLHTGAVENGKRPS